MMGLIACRTPLHVAAALSVGAGARLVAVLLLAGADVNHRDVTGRTPAMYAAVYARHSSAQHVQRLIGEWLTLSDLSQTSTLSIAPTSLSPVSAL